MSSTAPSSAGLARYMAAASGRLGAGTQIAKSFLPAQPRMCENVHRVRRILWAFQSGWLMAQHEWDGAHHAIKADRSEAKQICRGQTPCTM